MEISEVRALMLSCPVEPIMDAVNFIPCREALLVRVETDRGLIGIGEAACFGGALRTVKAIVEGELRPLLVGEDPLRIERLWDRMYSRTFQHGRRGAVIGAISSVDIALWDILGQVAGLPLYRLLGGYRSQIRAYASGGFYQEGKGPRELAQEMARYAAVGFQGVKMKVGRNPSAWIGRGAKGVLLQDQLCLVSPEEDLERVAAVREAIGQEVELMVDANTAWRPHEAIRMVRELERYHVYWLEEPVGTDDVEGSAQVAAATHIPVAGYETESTRYGFRELITRGSVGVVQADVTWAGGISECQRIAALAAAYGLPFVPHAYSSAIALVANLHLVASLPNGEWMELDRNPNPLREELITEPLGIDAQGFLPLPEGPGLGVELDEEVIARYQVG